MIWPSEWGTHSLLIILMGSGTCRKGIKEGPVGTEGRLLCTERKAVKKRLEPIQNLNTKGV